MRADFMKMIEEKQLFLQKLQEALIADEERNNLDSIAYEYRLDTMDEVISVIYRDGSCGKILATGNSNCANAKAILEEIYG